MARDIFVVPVSTVASESAFSTGGRVLDAFRSSLTPKIIEALICAQDWFRNSKAETCVEEMIEELEKLEKDFLRLWELENLERMLVHILFQGRKMISVRLS